MRFNILVLMLVFILAVPAYTQTDETFTPDEGGTLRVALTDAILLLDPMRSVSYSEWYFSTFVYEPLLTIDYDDPQRPIMPLLAESVEVSEDLTEWTLTLHAGITFHHGSLLTAEDVVFTYRRAADPELGTASASMLSLLEHVEAVDERQVRFRLSQPFHDFDQVLAHPLLGIVPADRTQEQIDTEPSGTGPFILVEFTPAERFVFTRNTSYWREGLPYLDGVELRIMPERNSQVIALTSGTIDMVLQIGAEAVPIIEANEDYKIMQTAASAHPVFVMDTNQPPFDDVRVRQAMKLVVDRAGLLQVVERGIGVVGNDQPIPPEHPYVANIPAPERDIEQARTLLAEAGYPDGIDVTLITAEVNPGLTTAAVAFQQMAQPAGINITVERVAPAFYWVENYMTSPFFMSYWGANIAPSILLAIGYQTVGFYNETGWQDATLDEMLLAAQAIADPIARQAALAEVQQFIATQDGAIIPYFTPHISAMRADVFGPTPDYQTPLTEVWIEQNQE